MAAWMGDLEEGWTDDGEDDF
uniref:Uncharacterized protein n=1 Tax=Arundo donax TaxID=35708 RepID=A0A0A8Z4M0_ARUDO